MTLLVPEGDLLAHQDLSYAAARDARGVLLGQRPLPQGTLYLGDENWPYAQSSSAPVTSPPPAPDRLDGLHLLVVGCGSVGSEALRLLSATGARFTLLDGGKVSIFNPHRQWFGAGEVSELKVMALARRLPRVRPLPFSLEATTLPELEALLDRDRPDAVLLATGTVAGALAAPTLWRRGIPHLRACAYARARFFEVAVLAPGERTPCLQCLRGHLDRGPEAQPPIDDELGRFLYQEVSPEGRERAYQELVAEPATPIETGRVADLAARCLRELVRPRSERPPWFRRLLAEGTTCLLGGNVVERPGRRVRLRAPLFGPGRAAGAGRSPRRRGRALPCLWPRLPRRASGRAPGGGRGRGDPGPPRLSVAYSVPRRPSTMPSGCPRRSGSRRPSRSTCPSCPRSRSPAVVWLRC